jgi:prolyl-tRNA synthetase
VQELLAKLKVTIRCIPRPGQPGSDSGPGRCIFTGQPSAGRAVFAKAY